MNSIFSFKVNVMNFKLRLSDDQIVCLRVRPDDNIGEILFNFFKKNDISNPNL